MKSTRKYVLLLWFTLCALGLAETPQVVIEAGTYVPLYQLGDKFKTVKVDRFLLDRYAVTNGDYLAFVEANPRWRRSQVKSVFTEANYLTHWSGDLKFDPKLVNSPVINVSWFAARAYAKWKGLRLPTQDEWEFVARADERSKDATQKPGFHRRILDFYGKPTPTLIAPVGSVYKNIYGVHDMHGLVWEWVSDFNSIMVTGESRQGTGIDRALYCAAGVIGSTNPSDYAAYMRYAFRSSLKARYTVGNLGFRCAKDIGKEVYGC